MFRLSKRACELLIAEIQHCATPDLAGQVQRDLAYKRLAKLCAQKGTPLTEAELRETLADLFPNFDDKVIKAAARANRPPSKLLSTVKFGVIAIAGLAGGIWVLNLPYPMIRYPVAKTMPMVLLPSFISMDHNYRQAIATTEQADQLINQATSSADFVLGEQKVSAAKKHLDALPVWFLGYYPQSYCSWFQCGWRFTLDEFEQARKNTARMESKLFQEKNAQAELEKADLAVSNAKQAYQAALNQAGKEAAIAQWQQAMDQLEQVSRQTLAGRNTQTKLMAYKRDFQQVVGFTADNQRSGNLMQAARFAAETAQRFSNKSAQTVKEWQEAEGLWKDAIAKLEAIKVDDPDYTQAQKQLDPYKTALSTTRIRAEVEQQSTAAFEQAEHLKESLFNDIQPGSRYLNPNQISQLQKIITELNKIKSGTTVYAEAQTTLKAARARLPQKKL